MKICIYLVLLLGLLSSLSGCVYRDGQFVRAHPWDRDQQITYMTTNSEYGAFVNVEPYPYCYLEDDCIWLKPVRKGCKQAGGGHH